MKRKASSPRKFWLLALFLLAALGLGLLLRPTPPQAPSLPPGQIYPKDAFKRPPPVYRFKLSTSSISVSKREKMRIAMVAGKPGRLLIKVLDTKGQVLRTLADLNEPQGSIQLDWDGSLAPGLAAQPGEYRLVVESADKTERIRVHVLP